MLTYTWMLWRPLTGVMAANDTPSAVLAHVQARGAAHTRAASRRAQQLEPESLPDSPRVLVMTSSSCEDIVPPKAWTVPSHGLYDVILLDYSVNGTCARVLAEMGVQHSSTVRGVGDTSPRGLLTLLQRPRTYKWPGVYNLLTSPTGVALLAVYDVFVISDDDVDFHAQSYAPRAFAPRCGSDAPSEQRTQQHSMYELACTCVLSEGYICQPALSRASAHNFGITRVPEDGGDLPGMLRLSRFVEQMTPVFSREALMMMLPYFKGLTHAWGIDALWSDLGERLSRRVGIVDSIQIDHMRKSGISGLYKRVGGLEKAREDQAAFKHRFGIREEIMALMADDAASTGDYAPLLQTQR